MNLTNQETIEIAKMIETLLLSDKISETQKANALQEILSIMHEENICDQFKDIQ